MILKAGNKEYPFEKGENLLDIMVRNGLEVENHCNGKGTCGKCRVKVVSGYDKSPGSIERKYLTDEEINLNIRLACQIKPENHIEIEEAGNQPVSGSILTSGYVPEFEKDNTYKGYGVAVDIGTTTMALSLADMESHMEKAQASSINPQKKYGMDVLTRITYAVENEEGIKDLQSTLVRGINDMIEEVSIIEAGEKGLDKEDIKRNIKEIAVSANCTMSHTLLGEDITPLGRYPYTPVFKETKKISARDIGIEAGEECVLYTLPQVSAFIGADIVAGAYVCSLGRREGNTLFIDIGTNGEIVLAKGSELMCCSCAAGPALEGMNIKYGMRAQEGAVEDIKIENDGSVTLKVIGDTEARGLCGSGILAAVRELVEKGLIKPRGAFLKLKEIDDSNPLKKLIREVDSKREFVLSDRVQVTQSDVRQVQLAKGAILSGFTALIQKAGIQMDDLDEVLIAGQFGSYLPEESLVGTGILPPQVKDRIVYMGNTSKTGAYMFLTSLKVRKDIENIAEKMYYYELSTMENYESIFRKSLMFK